MAVNGLVCGVHDGALTPELPAYKPSSPPSKSFSRQVFLILLSFFSFGERNALFLALDILAMMKGDVESLGRLLDYRIDLD